MKFIHEVHESERCYNGINWCATPTMKYRLILFCPWFSLYFRIRPEYFKKRFIFYFNWHNND